MAGPPTHPPQEHLDAAKLKAAIDFAISAEMKYPPELAKVADIRDLRISVPLKYAGEAFFDPARDRLSRTPPPMASSSATAISWRNGARPSRWI
jgi:hypothetical protein